MTSMTKYKEAKTKMKAALEESNKIVKTAFMEASEVVFRKYPNVETFSWTQYTPYFNDGDSCTFSANYNYPALTFTDGTNVDVNYGEGTIDKDQVKKEIREVTNFLQNFDDDDYESMFGDHVKVTVSKTGVEVEEYDHE